MKRDTRMCQLYYIKSVLKDFKTYVLGHFKLHSIAIKERSVVMPVYCYVSDEKPCPTMTRFIILLRAIHTISKA